MVSLTRRSMMAGAAAAAITPYIARPVFANGGPHGFSPLGALKYQRDEPFAYVNSAAPKGGTLRLKSSRPFATINTLRNPGRPPAELRVIYDRLVIPSDDEPASFYGVLAKDISVADDFSEVRLTIHPDARWHDGRPVTPEDVAFTLQTLKTEGAPFYRQSYGPLTLETDGGKVILKNARIGDRDLVRKIASIPIHPAHLWADGTPDDAVGSGPYRVAAFDPPNSMELEREPDYWGAKISPNKAQ